MGVGKVVTLLKTISFFCSKTDLTFGDNLITFGRGYIIKYDLFVVLNYECNIRAIKLILTFPTKAKHR